MNELTIKHIGEHYRFLQEFSFGNERHLAYANKLKSKDLIEHYLNIQDCNWFFNYPNLKDNNHYLYLNGKNLTLEKVDAFEGLADAEEYLGNFKKEIEHLFDQKGFITI
jgi:hypothetical protein